jgi:hypothetical protein
MTADILNLLNQAAAKYGLPPAVVVAQAEQESGGNQYDSSGNVLTSPAGAMGVMQLEPSTAAQLGVDPTDTGQNIDGGVHYLAMLVKEFGDLQLALAAYDWGPGHVQRNGFQNWPQETINYVASILKKAGVGVGEAIGGGGGGIEPGAPGAPPSEAGFSFLELAVIIAGVAIVLYVVSS